MDSLVLDIGSDIGALVINAGAEASETEIEISPGTDPAVPRSHNVVHARQGRHGTRYSAVFPSIPAGRYTVWHSSGTPHAVVTIRGGSGHRARVDLTGRGRDAMNDAFGTLGVRKASFIAPQVPPGLPYAGPHVPKHHRTSRT